MSALARARSQTACSRGASGGFVSLAHRGGRDLSQEELQAFVRELARRRDLWRHLVEHDSAQRQYVELLGDQHVTAWLICWMCDHDTGYHDHDGSAGAVAVVQGSVREERLSVSGGSRQRLFAAGQAFGFSAADIHRVRHAGAAPAITIHAYSPALLRMGAYVVDGDGVLARRVMDAREELRPMAAGVLA